MLSENEPVGFFYFDIWPIELFEEDNLDNNFNHAVYTRSGYSEPHVFNNLALTRCTCKPTIILLNWIIMSFLTRLILIGGFS